MMAPIMLASLMPAADDDCEAGADDEAEAAPAVEPAAVEAAEVLRVAELTAVLLPAVGAAL